MQEIQKIIKNSLQKHNYGKAQNATLKKIINCRTSEMGYLMVKCNHCDHKEIIPKSCRNRNCPVCQKSAQEKWVNNRLSQMIDCSYYHIVATTPEILYQIIWQNQSIMYKILQKASAKAILKLAKDERYLGAEVGILQILHTWTQKMLYHPHCHMLVTAGGVKDNKWVDCKNEDFLFPVKVYSYVFRGMFMEEFKKVRCKLNLYGEAEKYKSDACWYQLINQLYKKEFVTYIKEPYDDPMTVMDYFGRYAYKVAISSSRIVSYENGIVRFSYKDRKDNNKQKIAQVTDIEFTKRFAMHILPKGFRKIKAYGLFANAFLKQRLEKVKNMVKQVRKRIIEFVKKELHGKSCPKCGSSEVEVINLNFNPFLTPI